MDIRPTDFPIHPVVPTRETETQDPESSSGGGYGGGHSAPKHHEAETDETSTDALEVTDIVDLSDDYRAQHPLVSTDAVAKSEAASEEEKPPVRHLDIQA